MASGKIAPRTALILSFFLITLCLLLVSIFATSLTTLFIFYLALWTAYSIPPFRLKSVPIIDFIASGIGAGLLPFLIGVGTSSQLNLNMPLVLASAIPLMLAHSSGHILQALGDYEADSKNGIQTFVVKHGGKKGIIIMGLLSLTTGLLPLLYANLGLIVLSTYILTTLFLTAPILHTNR